MQFTAKMCGCLKCKISTPAYMSGVDIHKYRRTDMSETEFRGCLDFLTHGALLIFTILRGDLFL